MKISIVIDINVTCMPMLYLMSLFFFSEEMNSVSLELPFRYSLLVVYCIHKRRKKYVTHFNFG